MICDFLKKIINEYGAVYEEGENTGKFSHPLCDFIRNDVREAFTRIPVYEDYHIIKAGCGSGRMAKVPWIAVFDKRITESPQAGVYVIYLLNKDTKNLYLTFTHSAADMSVSSLKYKTENIRKQLGIKETEKIETGSESYDAGCICSVKYNIENLYDDEKVIEDLKEFLGLYKKYYNEFYGVQKESDYDVFGARTLPEEKKQMPIKEYIEHIKEYILSAGFNYDGDMIENFYLSLKSKPFVILAGISGTGKTRLVRLFAEAIGAEYNLVSVRPDWSDSSDLFGHVDLNQKFVKGDIIDFIKSAELNPSKPYILCLDEMNLARVEYYMSDILSVIETRRFENGQIVTDEVVPNSVFGNDFAAAGRYGKVILPENLYIVGTVNMDETTFPFSKKVLDRANTIEFSDVDLMAIPSFEKNGAKCFNLSNDFLKAKYITLNDCNSGDREYIEKVSEILQRINGILKNSNSHIGYRVRDEIVFYMLYNKKSGLIDETKAFDYQLMQKILPRIQGSNDSIRKMLGELLRMCEAEDYVLSKSKIEFMIKRYEEDGFTSYWL